MISMYKFGREYGVYIYRGGRKPYIDHGYISELPSGIMLCFDWFLRSRWSGS